MNVRRLALACVAVVTALWLAPAGARQAESAAFAITHGPYLQLPSATAMTIVWHTNRPAVSKVEYWEDGAGEARVMTAVSAAHGLIDNERTSHVIRLTGLLPGSTYLYRVISHEFQGYEKQHIVKYGATVSSELASFRTFPPAFARAQNASSSAPVLRRGRPTPPAQPAPPATQYSFTVFSDIHENAKRLDGMLARVDWNRTPFVVFNGDMVNDAASVDTVSPYFTMCCFS